MYYLIIREALDKGWDKKVTRTALLNFEDLRKANKAKAEKDVTKANYKLIEFDQLMRTAHDAYSLKGRTDMRV